ncbi:uncharacterized protein K452DRAFT_60054 [Aplosporella prunicola CBS 121167]|uniref:Uncharacterized protein n=1 Tax=Aplosporella prunicola CBS 121167 TaxID=1176127 RepID=A0A6A6B9Z1_9PEZI|nr:uncharacterized protein K452DRAFT_60054 [Aplosporella prunicola CBS 121167]KAF2140054.1 hypothetical protein K452DRAFT_60054 [Aplosporella prunicola CBS 121167]
MLFIATSSSSRKRAYHHRIASLIAGRGVSMPRRSGRRTLITGLVAGGEIEGGAGCLCMRIAVVRAIRTMGGATRVVGRCLDLFLWWWRCRQSVRLCICSSPRAISVFVPAFAPPTFLVLHRRIPIHPSACLHTCIRTYLPAAAAAQHEAHAANTISLSPPLSLSLSLTPAARNRYDTTPLTPSKPYNRPTSNPYIYACQ